MREIILVRHGKPLSAHNNKVNAVDYSKWVRAYDFSELDPSSKPGAPVDFTNSYVIVSPLKRAKLSAAHLGAIKIDEELPNLKEMDIPYYKLPLKLRAWHWVLLCRLMWFMGKTGRFESFKDAKKRVVELAEYLKLLSETQSKIILVGHGLTNRFLRKKLQAEGWSLQAKDNKFWGVTRLTR
ncbi:histidine phosphatase family protein [Alteromonas sp. 1_MG-2023]|uniref:histidine phosphatase family protein n=1 Tax=Alteromonas sp. 1_MG-2023 TaxID=3062669 RepID=UPI0026E229C1|nr:histidine phosphatase family protein [Alteromonas sp. 1_MG-2023]MDO6566682.1 histidine phosphatase family protein [Alteromonas sp. 1_MG-2023]